MAQMPDEVAYKRSRETGGDKWLGMEYQSRRET